MECAFGSSVGIMETYPLWSEHHDLSNPIFFFRNVAANIKESTHSVLWLLLLRGDCRLIEQFLVLLSDEGKGRKLILRGEFLQHWKRAQSVGICGRVNLALSLFCCGTPLSSSASRFIHGPSGRSSRGKCAQPMWKNTGNRRGSKIFCARKMQPQNQKKTLWGLIYMCKISKTPSSPPPASLAKTCVIWIKVKVTAAPPPDDPLHH